MTAVRWLLPRDPVSVRAARAAVRGYLVGPDAPATDTDAATLVVSELVANAVVHAAGDVEPIELTLDADEACLRIEVLDHDPSPPTLPERPPGPDGEGGRGLLIVDRVADRWGWCPLEGNGKRVWCDLRGSRRT